MKNMLSSTTASSSSTSSGRPVFHKHILKQRASDEWSGKKCLDKEFDAAGMAVDPKACIMPHGLNTVGYSEGTTTA